MARTHNRLTAIVVKNAKEPGRLSDGGGLYLLVRKDGRKSWIFRFTLRGKTRDMGLGTAPGSIGGNGAVVSLANARAAADEARKIVAEGRDPIIARRVHISVDQENAMPTFGVFADELVETISHGFKNQKHLAQWRTTIGDAYCSAIRGKPVDDVTTEDILGVLQPLWQEKQETANRIRARIERVLDAAKARGLRAGENPARWRGHLDALLPKRQRLKRGHYSALPFKQVPELWQTLSKLESLSAKALSFTILTAARSGETRGATWAEIDFEAALWSIPASRMKAGKPHVVPLSDEAMQILREAEKLRVGSNANQLVFPSKRNTPLSDMALAMCLRGIREGITVHGFRSSFRDWAGDATEYPRELAEQALAHVVGGVEGAYRRNSAVERRRQMMKDWAGYVHSSTNH